MHCRMASRRICDIVLGLKADVRFGRSMVFLKEAQNLLLQQVVVNLLQSGECTANLEKGGRAVL